MLKKISSVVAGLSIIGIIFVGVNNNFTSQAGHADFPVPEKPAKIVKL